MTAWNVLPQRNKTLEERFWEKVDNASRDGCWRWTSAIGSRGYGVFWVGGRKRSAFAHRTAYEMTHGPIPEGMVVMHSCDNPWCVNPAHLSVGSKKDNSQDALRKGRYRVGESNGGGGKLRNGDILEIRALMNQGYGCSRLSKRFGVSQQTIKAIKRGRIWSHVQLDCLKCTRWPMVCQKCYEWRK